MVLGKMKNDLTRGAGEVDIGAQQDTFLVKIKVTFWFTERLNYRGRIS
jgi:hypothetical protein